MTERVPPSLEAAVRSDLQPVHPLPSPARRALPLVPLVALTLVAASWVFAFRGDARVLGWPLTWGVSAFQALFAFWLIALALRDSIPGRALHASAVWLAAGSVLGFSIVVTLRTWDLSPTMILPESVAWVGRACLMGTIVSAVPLLIAAAVLSARAFVVRPWSSGVLYGLGAGLGADAGWRLFCHYSDPMHVLATHTGAVLATMAMGVLAAAIGARRARS